jgi:hypothetical protein
MTAADEIYTDIKCPRCGYIEARDAGPYESDWTDDALGGPPDPRVHLMWCGRCGKPFDWIEVADGGAIAAPADPIMEGFRIGLRAKRAGASEGDAKLIAAKAICAARQCPGCGGCRP